MPGIAQEVRVEILTKVKSGMTVPKVAEQYGVSTKTIYTWLKKTVQGPVSALELAKLRRENGWLKEIIGTLTIELEKAKKKAA